MSENAKNNGGPAFPNQHVFEAWTQYESGMSLRDYFAAKAMQGYLVNHRLHMNELANLSYKMADAMLKAREM